MVHNIPRYFLSADAFGADLLRLSIRFVCQYIVSQSKNIFCLDMLCVCGYIWPQYVFVALTFCRQYAFSAGKFRLRYVLSHYVFPYTLSLPVRFIADTFCPPLRFVPICFVHCFVCRYVLGSIRFVSVKICRR
jgi:hypothetical protein